MSELQAAHRAGRVLAAAERYRRAWEANEAATVARRGAEAAREALSESWRPGDGAEVWRLACADCDAAGAACDVTRTTMTATLGALTAAARGEL